MGEEILGDPEIAVVRVEFADVDYFIPINVNQSISDVGGYWSKSVY